MRQGKASTDIIGYREQATNRDGYSATLGFFNRAGEQTKSGAALSFGQGQLCSGDRKDFLSAATGGCPRSQLQLGKTTSTGGKPCASS